MRVHMKVHLKDAFNDLRKDAQEATITLESK